MSATRYLLITKVFSTEHHLQKLATQWKSYINSSANIYLNENHNELIELKAINNPQDIFNKEEKTKKYNLINELGSMLNSDFHQELLEFKENVIPQKDILPNNNYLQLRHIEVPIKVIDNYSDWRNETIFQHVKSLKNVDSFVAYHSLFSTLPGVMFICNFSCEPSKYLLGFNNEDYKNIITQAGNKYIAGGKEGLYTKIYKKY